MFSKHFTGRLKLLILLPMKKYSILKPLCLQTIMNKHIIDGAMNEIMDSMKYIRDMECLWYASL